MERRKFFTRCSQALAGAVLATHLHFGNLAPIPQRASAAFKWSKLFFKKNGESIDIYLDKVDDVEVEWLNQHTEEFQKREGTLRFQVNDGSGSTISYLGVPDDYYLPNDDGLPEGFTLKV